MPDELYEIIALAARYWFLLLMVLIAWRSFRWFARDRRKYKRRLKLLPDAGYVGELVVVSGDDTIRRGVCLPVAREGQLGYLRSNDVCLPVEGVAGRHLWFLFDDTDGLRVQPLRGRTVKADGTELTGAHAHAFLSHGSTLQVGRATLKLRMFSGFEYASEVSARRRPLDEAEDTSFSAEEAAYDKEDRAVLHSPAVRRMHEMAEWQEAMDAQEPEQNEPVFYPPVMDQPDLEDDYLPPSYDEIDALPPEEDPAGNSYVLFNGSRVFYPPVEDEADDVLMPPDGEPLPKDLYVDEDEAQTAKRVLWDRVFKGGNKR